MTTDITLADLMTSYDWEEAFGEGSGGNTDQTVEATPPGSPVSTAPTPRADVAEIIAASNGVNDEQDCVGLFRMNDGRYLVVVAGCDYTGWDCQASNNLTVAGTLEDAIRFGRDDAQRRRLGVELPSPLAP